LSESRDRRLESGALAAARSEPVLRRNSMSRGKVRTFLYLAVTVLFVASVAMAAKGKNVKVYSDAVLPNGQELKAGQYSVLVDNSASKVTFMKGKEVVAEAECKVFDEPKKHDCNEVRTVEKGDKQEVQEIRLGGEKRSILLTQEGM
jgi:hypothetical protein